MYLPYGRGTLFHPHTVQGHANQHVRTNVTDVELANAQNNLKESEDSVLTGDELKQRQKKVRDLKKIQDDEVLVGVDSMADRTQVGEDNDFLRGVLSKQRLSHQPCFHQHQRAVREDEVGGPRYGGEPVKA